MLVKLDLRKKAACIAEQYHTVLKLQGQASTKKRVGANQENQQPNQQPPGKKPFLRNLLPRTPTYQSSTDCSPYARILRSRRSPLLKSGPFAKKYWGCGEEEGSPCPSVGQLLSLRNRSLLSFTIYLELDTKCNILTLVVYPSFCNIITYVISYFFTCMVSVHTKKLLNILLTFVLHFLIWMPNLAKSLNYKKAEKLKSNFIQAHGNLA